IMMSLQTPPRLLELAGKSLLGKEAMTIYTLEELPIELFPPLFMEAFTRRCSETLKAMVQAWPFPRLPLGSLMKTPQLEILKAVLDGLDGLLFQFVHPRRWKLQVLDLRNVDQNFWSVWSGATVSSPEAMSRRKPVEDCPGSRRQQPLKVFVDFHLNERSMDEFFTCLFQWAKLRNGLLHICCKNLKIFETSIKNIRKALKLVDLDCIQEVEVNCTWTLSTLAGFALYLGQMHDLYKLVLSHIYVSPYISPEKEELVAQFTSQFLKLEHLQELYMDSVSFLEGHLDQLLRCLKDPLETLAITNCLLSRSDLRHLSQCPSISQLKVLELTGVRLTHFSPKSFHILIEKIAATVQTLDLDECGILDSQLNAILPALSHCSQLTTFSFRENAISMAALENLLHQTVRMSTLSLELYDVPLETSAAWVRSTTGVSPSSRMS
ncbi:PRAME family member 12-like, partial [Carlito syrichta]|uniref:PRAME family member 12-like n=1 Tax=Carlito syrichta TaxID=1868482 RepID=A0A1U7UPL6_CARSF